MFRRNADDGVHVKWLACGGMAPSVCSVPCWWCALRGRQASAMCRSGWGVAGQVPEICFRSNSSSCWVAGGLGVRGRWVYLHVSAGSPLRRPQAAPLASMHLWFAETCQDGAWRVGWVTANFGQFFFVIRGSVRCIFRKAARTAVCFRRSSAEPFRGTAAQSCSADSVSRQGSTSRGQCFTPAVRPRRRAPTRTSP